MTNKYKIEMQTYYCPTIRHEATIIFKNYPIEFRPPKIEYPKCLSSQCCPITEK